MTIYWPLSLNVPPLIQNCGSVWNSDALGPGNPVTFSTPPIIKKKSGNFLIQGQMGGDLNGDASVRFSLYRDGGVLLAVTASHGHSNWYDDGGFGFLSWCDCIEDSLPHYWSLKAIGSPDPSNINIPPHFAQLTWIEL